MTYFNSVVKSVVMLLHELFPFLVGFLKFVKGRTVVGFIYFVKDSFFYSKINNSIFRIKFMDLYPCLTDRFSQAGSIPRHYFLQDLWAASKVYNSHVQCHYDVGSRLDGFIAHCLSFCKVVMFDVRDLNILVNNLEFQKADFSGKTNIPESSIPSLSSLHAIEHFGLGRYGDPINPNGYCDAINEFIRIVVPGGDIYVSVPVGKRRLVYNAHRIFDPFDIVELFEGCMLVEFSVIDDDGVMIHNTNPEDYKYKALDYGCGLYHFKKNGV
jgi:hypothetical protein